MRKILSLVLVLAMVLSSFPAFAAVDYTTVGNELKELGVIIGDNTGNLLENENLTREQAMVVLARLNGVEEEAKATTLLPSFTDVTANNYYTPFIAYAEMQKWTNGIGGGLFGYGRELTAAEFHTLMVRVLGYEVATLEAGVAKAVELGLAADSNVTDLYAPIIRGEVFIIMKNTLWTVPVGETQALVYVLKLAEVPVPAELKVLGAATNNYKEVVLTFNSDVDATEAAKAANYAIKGNTVANVAVDGAQVTLTLGTEIAPQGTIEVTVKKAVGLTEDAIVKVENVIDAVPPSVTGVEVSGNRQLKITFSEPIKEGFTQLVTYKINGNFFAASTPTISADRKVVTLNVTNRLPAGEHKLVIGNTVKDYANFALIPNETTFVVVNDATAPVVESVTATQTKLVVVFNEAIEQPALADIVPTVGTAISRSVEGNELTVMFSVGSPLPITVTEITLKNITDMFGNKAADLKINVAATPDLVRPEFVSATVLDQESILVKFSKDINTDGIYTLKDADGKLKQVNGTETALADPPVYYVKDGVTYNDQVVLKLVGGVAFKATSYTLTISNVTDINPLANRSLAITTTVVIPDKVAPTFTINMSTDATIDAANNANKIYVNFDKAVDASTATMKTNYNYLLTTFNALNAATTVTLLADNKTVEITFPKTGTSAVNAHNITQLQVSGVKDTSGNVVVTQAVTLNNVAMQLGAAPLLTNPVVTGKNTVTLDVTGKLLANTVTVSDFIVENTAGTPVLLNVINAVYDATKDLITLTINEDITPNAQFGGFALRIRTIPTTNAKDVLGRSVQVLGNTPIVDKFVPTATFTAANSTANTLTITFSEEMEVNDVAINGALAGPVAAQMIVTVNGNVVTPVSVVATSATEIVITLSALAANDVVVVNYFASVDPLVRLRDAANNNVANFSLTRNAQN